MIGWATCTFQNSAYKKGCRKDYSWAANANDSTSLAFFLRTANVAYSLFNSSIMMIDHVSPPLDQHISPSDLFPILDQIFSPINSSLRIPPLSLIDNLINHLYFDSEQSVFAGTIYLQSILTIPVLWFEPNDLNYNKQDVENIPTPNLPPELYVTGKFAQSVNRILISQWTVVLFMLISIGIFVWSVGWLAWAMTIQGPRIGPFPLVDFASRIASAGTGEILVSDIGLTPKSSAAFIAQ